MGETPGRVVSVNVGKRRTVEWHGRDLTTGIFKEPVAGSVAVDEFLAGDEIGDGRVHGGPDQAVYAYSTEDYAWWASSMPSVSFGPGLFGENLTTEGVALGRAVVGERWQVGTVVLEVRLPRFPCVKLGMKMGDAAFKDIFEEARRNGTYFSVVTPGSLAAGDSVVRLSQPDHGVTIDDLIAVEHDAPVDHLERVLAVPGLAASSRKSATRHLSNLRS